MKGIYTPIAVPFTAGERIDYDRLLHNLGRLAQTKLDGLVVLGSNGEFVFLNKEEKLQLVKFVKENFPAQKKIIVGTAAESTRETIELSLEMASLGADAVLLLPPHYYKASMNDEVLHRYFTEVADALPIPLMLYNMPLNTGLNLSSALVAELAGHKNIAGIKDTAGNIVQLAEIVRDTDDSFAVFAGNAGYLLPALTIGARGATLALGNILPEDCCRLVDLFQAGRLPEAKELQLKMLAINAAVTGKYGIPGLKYAMDILGYQGGLPRRPLLPLDGKGQSAIREMLREYGALS